MTNNHPINRSLLLRFIGAGLMPALLLTLAGCATVGLVKNPSTAEDYFQRGQYYYSYAGGFEAKKAIPEFSQAIKINPQYTDAFIQRGNCYSFLDVDLAIADYTSAITLRPMDTTLYMKRADLWYRKGDYGSAISDFSRALEIRPDDYELYFSRGLFYSYVDEYDKAINDLEKVNSLNPNAWYPYYMKAQLLERMNRFDEAINVYEVAGKAIPKKEMALIPGFIAGGLIGAWMSYSADLGYTPSQRKTMIEDRINALEKHKNMPRQITDFPDDKPIEIGMTSLDFIKIIEKSERIIFSSASIVVTSKAAKESNDGSLTVYEFKDNRVASFKKISFQTIRNLPAVSFPASEETKKNGSLWGMPKDAFMDLARQNNIILYDSEKETIAVGEDGCVKDKRLKYFYFENGRFFSYGHIFKKLW